LQDTHIGDIPGLSIVVNVHRPDINVAVDQVQVFHQVTIALVQVDGSRVGLIEGQGGFDGLQYGMPLGPVYNIEILARDGANIHLLSWIAAACIEPAFAGPGEEALVFQGEHGLFKSHLAAKEVGVLLRKRRFIGSAKEVERQDVLVVRIYQSVLHRFAEELLRMAHQILIQRIIQADEHIEGSFTAPAGTSGLLPCGGHRARVASKHGSIQPTDIHAQF